MILYFSNFVIYFFPQEGMIYKKQIAGLRIFFLDTGENYNLIILK